MFYDLSWTATKLIGNQAYIEDSDRIWARGVIGKRLPLLLLISLICSAYPGQAQETSTSDIISFKLPAPPAPKDSTFKTENLDVAELADLQKARDTVKEATEKLMEIEKRIRRAHGEFVREGRGLYTLECRTERSIVELRGEYALITTEYPIQGCF